MTNLRSFLSELERLNNAHAELPSYTAAILVATSHAVAVGALWRIYPHQVQTDAPVVWLVVLIGVGAVAGEETVTALEANVGGHRAQCARRRHCQRPAWPGLIKPAVA